MSGAGPEDDAWLAATALREEPFEHGSFRCSLLLPLSSDELFDQAAFDRDERLPYWADLWPAAKALARWIIDEPTLPARAIDLGCGVGLTTLALLQRGVQVVATDYEPSALRFVTANARRNGLATPTTMALDWREPVDVEPAPLVVGADLLYEGRNADSLATLLPSIVAPVGRALLADPLRPWRQRFIDALHERSWRGREVAAGFELGPTGKPVEIVFLDCRREAAGSLL